MSDEQVAAIADQIEEEKGQAAQTLRLHSRPQRRKRPWLWRCLL